MKVFQIPEHGFCFGVKRSIEMAYNVARSSKEPIYTYGPLIHNPQVVEQLKKEKIIPIEGIENLPIGKLIIRSHGVALDVINRAQKLGYQIVDATCPFVKRAQEYAKKLWEEGYKVIIVGEYEHPEVQGILGHINDEAQVIENSNSINKLCKTKKIGVVAQTTLSPENLKEVVAPLAIKGEEVRVYNTICKDVILRQHHTIELAKKVNLMIIIGGKNSANTRRLFELARAQSCETYHVETEEEVNPQWLKGKSKIGVSGGASTPGWIIDKVIEKIRVLAGGENEKR